MQKARQGPILRREIPLPFDGELLNKLFICSNTYSWIIRLGWLEKNPTVVWENAPGEDEWGILVTAFVSYLRHEKTRLFIDSKKSSNLTGFRSVTEKAHVLQSIYFDEVSFI